MDSDYLIFAALLFIVLGGVVIGVRYLAPIIAQHFKGSGGWGRLSETYATTRPLPAPALRRQTVVVGQVMYRRCMTVGCDDRGLYLETSFPISILGRRCALIPWTEFKKIDEGRLFWRPAAALSIGDPPISTITVPIELFNELIRPALGKAAPGLRSGFGACVQKKA